MAKDMQRNAALLAALALALHFASRPAACAEPEAGRPGEFRAPDGVLYDNEESDRLMQMKSLSGNLLSNGGFELGRYWPSGWQATDGLSTFWVGGASEGRRCMRLFTNVLREQWNDHDTRVRHTVDAIVKAGRDPQKLPTSPLPPPPERLPTRPPYYDTVGGLDGVHYRSEYIKCEPGAIYRFSVDARNEGKGEPRVFIKGFFDQKMKTANGVEVVRRNSYRAPMILDPCGEQWRRYVRLFHPSRSKSTLGAKPLPTEYIQVQLYAYWPVGNYYFDNVRIDIVGREAPEQPEAEQQPAEPEPDEKEQEEPPKLDEHGFPIFGD